MRLAALLLLLVPVLARGQELRYERFVLDNGLTVILHEDHRLPTVAINTWFYVGAKEEPVGRSGFAHLFEHLMFMGTERVPEGAFDTIMEGKGGANNASTDFDRTNYYSWGPAEILPTLLWLDADRLEGLPRAMTERKLDLQREVVRNERRQTSENVPYGKSQLALVDLLYPEPHPYHDDVIGKHADLEAATVADVKEFFANFYVPNNASLVVAGDFQPAEVRPLIERLFGDIPRGPDPTRRPAAPPVLRGETRQTLFDEVRLPMIRMGWISPCAYAPGDAEMSIAADVLSREGSGRLYRRLVIDEELAVDLSVSQQPLVLGSSFTLEATVRDVADLDRVERIIDEEIARLATWGPDADELQRTRVAQERGALDGLQDLQQKADVLNEYQYFYGDPDSLARDLGRYRAATREGVSKYCREVLGADRVVIRVLPDRGPQPASARDAAPADFARGQFKVHAPQSFKTTSGIPVLLWNRGDLPLVEIGLLFKQNGQGIDAPGKAGGASLLARMMSEAAGERDSEAFANALESLGAELSIDVDQSGLTVELSALSENLAASVALMADAVLRPRLDAGEFERLRRLRIDELKQRADRPEAVGAQLASRLLLGGDRNPAAWPDDGTAATVQGLTLADLQMRYQELIGADGACFVVAGDVDEPAARALLEGQFGGLRQRAAATRVADWRIPAAEGLRLAIVDRPGAVQTFVIFAMPGITRTDPQRTACEMLESIFGGSFTSRLNQNLREDKGYTYGARCRFRLDPRVGVFTASSSVRTDVTGASIAEFMKEFARLRAGDVTDEEVMKARGQLRTGAMNRIESLGGLVGLALDLEAAGLGMESVALDLAAAEAIDAAQLNGLAHAALPVERGVLVLVGDAAEIERQIADLKLPAAERIEVTD